MKAQPMIAFSKAFNYLTKRLFNRNYQLKKFQMILKNIAYILRVRMVKGRRICQVRSYFFFLIRNLYYLY